LKLNIDVMYKHVLFRITKIKSDIPIQFQGISFKLQSLLNEIKKPFPLLHMCNFSSLLVSIS
jgi:hypothetical protein